VVLAMVWALVTVGLVGYGGPSRAWATAVDLAFAAPPPNTAVVGPVAPTFLASTMPPSSEPDTVQGRQRPRPIEYSDGYYVRLKIHYFASFATLPLFAAEYFIGRSLYNNPGTASRSLRGWHSNVAVAIAGLFTLNTVTGLWNLWEGRHDPAGRTRRYVHAFSMLAADAGFLATSQMTPHRDFRRSGGTVDQSSANTHRALAISSMSVSLASYVMMLVWKN